MPAVEAAGTEGKWPAEQWGRAMGGHSMQWWNQRPQAAAGAMLDLLASGSESESDEEVLDYVRATGMAVYHPIGTCKMGNDAMAVVDDQLRVHGLRGLRVIDASVMPAMTNGNTHAPTMMIAERGADLIKQAAKGD